MSSHGISLNLLHILEHAPVQIAELLTGMRIGLSMMIRVMVVGLACAWVWA